MNDPALFVADLATVMQGRGYKITNRGPSVLFTRGYFSAEVSVQDDEADCMIEIETANDSFAIMNMSQEGLGDVTNAAAYIEKQYRKSKIPKYEKTMQKYQVELTEKEYSIINRVLNEVYGAGHAEEAMSNVREVENKASEAYKMLDDTSFSNPNKASLLAFCSALKIAEPSIKSAYCYKTTKETPVIDHWTYDNLGSRTEKDIALEIVLDTDEPKRYSMGNTVLGLQRVLDAIMKHRNVLNCLKYYEVKRR